MAPSIWRTTACGAAATPLASGNPRSSENNARAAPRRRAAQRAPLSAARMGRLLGARRTELGKFCSGLPLLPVRPPKETRQEKRRAFNLHTRGRIGKGLPRDARRAAAGRGKKGGGA